MLSYAQAQEIIRHAARSFGTEAVALSQARNRVLAQPVHADRDYPPFNRATMDGFALQWQDFEAGIREFKAIEEIFAGQPATRSLTPGTCYKIMTGAVVPATADAVIRREDANQIDTQVVFNNPSLKKFQNIARQGEDVKQDSLLLAAGTLCHAPEINALATLGMTQVAVQKLPRVALFSTGDEVVPAHAPVLPHQIRDSNSYVLEALLGNCGVVPVLRKLIPDDEQALENAFAEGLTCDMVVISGGVSAGDADFVPAVLERLGVKKIFHKVAIRPGKPLWFGEVPGGCTVFALPGNPVSCQVTFRLFIQPFLEACWQMPEKPPLYLPLLREKKKKVQLDEFFPVRLSGSGLLPLSFSTSGDVTATLGSDGIALHPATSADLAENESVNCWLW